MKSKLGIIALVALLQASAAFARPAFDVTTTYYADPAHKVWAGSTELTCGGGRISYGRVTRFSAKQSDSCSNHRISAAAVTAYSRDPYRPLWACHALCSKRYGHPSLCLPDSCPGREALEQCDADCEANYTVNDPQ